ncbi:coiled-coil alpha-helical rod protein 1 isoform X1 [Pelobates fuscus]|uniref:coiled-coil alpha-helical rod protein 1 isoform X1 n=1 Tax=Pelobates fuscus TaxID=191477 RepID=UPI002FE44A7D
MEKKTLDIPPVYSPSMGRGHSGLMPPSHFETPRRFPAPPPSVSIPPPSCHPTVYEPWEDLAEQLSQLRKENEELKKRWVRGESTRARSLDRHQPQAESQALEIISQQMQEIRQLELAVSDIHEKEEKLVKLTQEVQELKQALRESKEAEERRRLAEDLATRKHQEELSVMSENHKMESSTLKRQEQMLALELKESHQKQEQEVTCLRRDLQTATQERECLAEQLSRCHLQLESQNALVQQLRTYIGELVPDNRRLEEQKRERAELRNTIQILEKERETLQTSVSLLHTRLSSLTNILSLQETELCKKEIHGDREKTQLLLSRWREKVFSLMVQMKSEDINRTNDREKIREKISLLENSLEESNQQQILLSHSLQDRTAELEMERFHSKSLQAELSATQANSDVLRIRGDKADQVVLQLKAMIDRFVEVMAAQEGLLKMSLSRLVTLGQRVSFAAKRVDATQGLVAQKLALRKLAQERDVKAKDAATESDICRPSYEDLQLEVKFLHDERDRLSLELKRSALLIEGKVKETRERVAAELAEWQHTASNLRQSLREAEQIEHELKEKMKETETRLQETCEIEAQLREQLHGQKTAYETEMQRKVSEAEEKMTQQLAQMEKHLHEARREHTKAVVALRQSERQMQREKARTQETLHTMEEAARLREEQLSRQLREAERDKNLMIATLRQEGLLTTYQKNRSSAIPSIRNEKEQSGTDSQTPGPRPGPSSRESISAMLANLQSLGDTLLTEEEEEDDEEHVNPQTK